MQRIALAAALTLALVVSFSVTPARLVKACAIVRASGADLDLSTERVVIIWDEDDHRQHFIRDAEFHGDGEAFGFLVPTPSMPELDDANEGLIPTLATRSVPEEIAENDYRLGTCCTLSVLGAGRGPDTALMPSALELSGVSVVSTQRVGNLDASVLRVNDAASLPAWLDDNGFEIEDSIIEWAAPYAESGHFITAFKFDPASSPGFSTGAIRISFDAERPFYPYREPQAAAGDTSGAERWLRVYFLADQRASGEVAGSAFGDTYFSAPVPRLASADLGELSEYGVSDDTWLTVFDDRTARRPDADVFFQVEAGDELRPDPIVYSNPVTIPVPLEIILPLGLAWYWRRRRLAAAAREPDGQA